jgi:hypothetical protein
LCSVVAAIFGGICNHTFNHEWNFHHACWLMTPHSVPKIWWYSHALLQENTTLVEFWAQHHCGDSSSTLQ